MDVDADRVVVTRGSRKDDYELNKYMRSNQGTIIHQSPIVSVDDKARAVTIVAAGREPGEDPYYTHAYRVSLDTGTIKLLNPGDASHAVSASDSRRVGGDQSHGRNLTHPSRPSISRLSKEPRATLAR